MDFAATIYETSYQFSFINPNTVLVSGKQEEFILYKARHWNCADEIDEDLLHAFGKAIDARLKQSPAHK